MKKTTFAFLPAIALALATVAAAPALRAQSAMTAGSASVPAKTYNQLLSMQEHELVPLAEAMPADKYNFAPSNGNFKGVRTFAEQLTHIIHANYAFFGDAAGITPASMPKMSDLKTKDQIVQALKDSFAFGHRAIGTLTAQNAFEPVKPMDGVSTRAGMVSFAMIHMNDHFGQLVEYLRMNGIVPPSSQPMPMHR